jgi:PAS domain S-box-containing protein
MKSWSRPNRKVPLAFGSAILVLLVVGAISYRGMLVSTESERWVRHTHEVLDNLEDLRFAMVNAQSSWRGFALTARDSFLPSYRAAMAAAAQHEANLRLLTLDNPAQQRRLTDLHALLGEALQPSEIVMGLHRTKALAPAAIAIQTGPGLMDELQAAVRQLRDEEMRLLALRESTAKRRLGQAKAVLILGTVLGLLIAAGAGWSLQRDASRRGLASDALRDSEQRFLTLRDGIQDHAISMLDPQGQIVSWNAGAERLTGYRAAQIVGHSSSCFLPPEDVTRGRLEEVLQMTAASGRHEEQGMRVRKDGTRFLAHVILTSLRDPAGELRGFSEIIRDLTETKESGAKYRGLLEAAPDAMVVVNQVGAIVLLNARAEKQFGYLHGELVGQMVQAIVPQGFAERLIADGTRSAAEALAQQIGTGIELSGRRKDGSLFPIEIMLSPLASAEGILVTAAIRDITARKQSEAQLLAKVDELNRSNEELGQFASIAFHDLQEPLRMVASYTQLLSRRYRGRLDADADEFIAFAVDGATRMQRLIQDLLAYSRVGTKGGDLVATSSADACQQALSNLRGAIDESGALVTSDPLPIVLADEMQLIQLFQNLVGNGIKYQSPGVPRVHISAARTKEERWMFSVQDNGLGIDPQYFDRIFGMFQRLHKREEFGGTGIGLAICKKIVARHGGCISVESQPGAGSTFRFALQAVSKIMKPSEDNGMPLEVLLVEDCPGDVRLTREAFREANRSLRLHVASDGVEAMAFLKREGAHVGAPRPDLILLDLNLPKMDGREVLARIKEDDSLKLIPTIILTTSEDEVDIAKSYQLQANCYLSKPVQLDAFETLVKSINDFWLTKAKLPQQEAC